MKKRFVLAITGASGAIYATRLMAALLDVDADVHLTISPSGVAVIKQELGLEVSLTTFDPRPLVEYQPPWSKRSPYTLTDQAISRLHYHHHQDYMTPIASGSYLTDAMIVCPCSGSTLAGIARAASSNLIQRAAEVHLKEHRKLIMVPRETPLSVFALENMHRLAAAGAIMLPAMPGWYHGVEDLDSLVDFIVGRILDQAGVGNAMIRRWGE